jgi:CRISPR/Cas system-associated exonuclease Cas4 (RecB family)
VEEFSSFYLDHVKINLAIDCAIREGKEILLYDWKTGRSIPESLSVQLCCYALYAMEKWRIPPESLKVIEYNLTFNKASWFSVTQGEVEDIKEYIQGSMKDMKSLLVDLEHNVPFEEERFNRVEDEKVSLRCNFRKVCRV